MTTTAPYGAVGFPAGLTPSASHAVKHRTPFLTSAPHTPPVPVCASSRRLLPSGVFRFLPASPWTPSPRLCDTTLTLPAYIAPCADAPGPLYSSGSSASRCFLTHAVSASALRAPRTAAVFSPIPGILFSSFRRCFISGPFPGGFSPASASLSGPDGVTPALSAPALSGAEPPMQVVIFPDRSEPVYRFLISAMQT